MLCVTPSDKNKCSIAGGCYYSNRFGYNEVYGLE